MSLNLNDLLTVFDLKKKNYSQIETILFEYGTLSQKLKNLEAHSSLFKKGLENAQTKTIISDTKNIFQALVKFCDERDWAKFHNPKDLGLSETSNSDK